MILRKTLHARHLFKLIKTEYYKIAFFFLKKKLSATVQSVLQQGYIDKLIEKMVTYVTKTISSALHKE